MKHSYERDYLLLSAMVLTLAEAERSRSKRDLLTPQISFLETFVINKSLIDQEITEVNTAISEICNGVEVCK
jgi:hypothetical protein